MLEQNRENARDVASTVVACAGLTTDRGINMEAWVFTASDTVGLIAYKSAALNAHENETGEDCFKLYLTPQETEKLIGLLQQALDIAKEGGA